MITEDYVSFEMAKLLKEKGFNEKTYRCYNLCTEEHELSDTDDIALNNWELDNDGVAAPTLQMAMKWLREKCYCHIVIDYTFKADANLSEEYVSYCYSVENAKTYVQCTYNEWYSTYEEACDAAIKYCLENLI